MKQIIVALFALASAFAGMPAAAFANADVAAACDGPVPEAYKRPGGFCDQNDYNRSLTGPLDSIGCVPTNVAMIDLPEGERVHIAAGATTCCTVLGYNDLQTGEDRVQVADVTCCPIFYRVPSAKFRIYQASLTDLPVLPDVRDRVMHVAC